MKSLVIGMAAAVLASTASLAASAAGPGPATPAATFFSVGKLSLVSLADARFVLPNDGKVFGLDAGGADKVAEVLRAAHAPTDDITLAVDALLVHDGARVVLIDTGLGPVTGSVLMSSLKLAHVTPGQVTDVLVTHAHFDHVGGLVTADGRSAFPNAKIRISSPDWEWLKGQADQAALVKAVSPQVDAFEPGARVTPSIVSVPIKGHTPGHVGYEVSSGSARLLDIGDTAHSAILSLARPGWTNGFDGDAEAAKASRIATLKALAASHEEVFAPHFPYPGVGTVRAAGEGFEWQPAAIKAPPKSS
jgi:glyoxylase-like metal-dependent hydrolase (beta-lactamase superfamily II)